MRELLTFQQEKKKKKEAPGSPAEARTAGDTRRRRRTAHTQSTRESPVLQSGVAFSAASPARCSAKPPGKKKKKEKKRAALASHPASRAPPPPLLTVLARAWRRRARAPRRALPAKGGGDFPARGARLLLPLPDPNTLPVRALKAAAGQLHARGVFRMRRRERLLECCSVAAAAAAASFLRRVGSRLKRCGRWCGVRGSSLSLPPPRLPRSLFRQSSMWMSDRKAELSDYTLAQGPPLLCFSFKQNTPRGEGGESGGGGEPAERRAVHVQNSAGIQRGKRRRGDRQRLHKPFSVPSCCTGPAPTFSAAAHARLLAEATSPARRPLSRWAS